MKLKKPNFWDYKKPSLLAYILLPLSYLLILLNLFNYKKKIKFKKIKTICIGNIYLGGTGKTPISIEICKILKKINLKTSIIKKYYKDQLDEQILLSNEGRLFCEKSRTNALNKAINECFDVAIFDDGLQDKKINYDISFVCFNIESWIGNGFTLPAGPLRESLNNLKKYDCAFLNGNGEATNHIKNTLKNINPFLKIFEAKYFVKNIDKFDQNINYIAFSGIGNPDSFLKTLKKNNFKIIKNFTFPDHYSYSDLDLTKIKKTANNLKAKIITTQKDYNRLNNLNTSGIEFLKINLKINNENEFINFLNNTL